MTLLAPISALIAAALTVPALLFFYFLKLKRRPVRVSSTMLFEDAASDLQVNVPFKWIRPSWLLLLQLIALALLLIALGRPAINMDAPPADRLVILIDRSASMNALDPSDPTRTTRLDRAKGRAREIVRRSGGAGRVMIVPFSGSARAVTDFSTRQAQLLTAIDLIEPTDGHADIRSALALVQAIIAGGAASEGDEGGEGGEGGNGGNGVDVVLLSDGSFDESEPLHLPGATVRYEPISPPQTTQTLADTHNIAIDALSASRDPNDPTSIRTFIRLISTNAAHASITLTLALDNEVVRRKVVQIPPMIDDAPGEAALTERFIAPAGTLLTASIDTPQGPAPTDALSADNTAAVVLPPATRPRVLLVEPTGPTANTSFLIADVLGELPLAEVRRVGSTVADDMQRRGELSPFSLIVFDRTVPALLPNIPSISFAAPLPIDGLAATQTDAPTRVLSWRRTDRLMRDVSLDALVIADSIALSLDPSLEATTLARGSDGPLIVRLDANGIEHIIVAFDLRQSTWPLSPSFAIFLSNAVDSLAANGGGGGEATSFTTADLATIRAPDGWNSIAVSGPRSITIDRETQAFTRSAVPLGVLENAGLYTVTIDGTPAPPIAVNLTNRTESTLAVENEITIGGETLGASAGTSEPREIWHWFVLASLIALACEWLVNAAMMRV